MKGLQGKETLDGKQKQRERWVRKGSDGREGRLGKGV